MSGTTKAFSALVLGIFAAVSACSAAPDGPSKGNYTVSFPSTQAAVATDSVVVYVFDGPKSAADRAGYCQALIQARKKREPQRPISQSKAANICELLQGRQPIEVAYGEKALMAIGLRGDDDFLIGCVIQSFGDGDAALDIDLTLVDVGVSVPFTDCKSVSAACTEGKCTRR